MISDFEGIAVGKTNYLWDDVKMVGHSGIDCELSK